MLAALRAIAEDKKYQSLTGWPHFTSNPTEQEWKQESAEKAWRMVWNVLAKYEAM
jgi:peptide methionine sulfoxide reductase MsrB